MSGIMIEDLWYYGGGREVSLFLVTVILWLLLAGSHCYHIEDAV
jgi:hypothetical protein